MDNLLNNRIFDSANVFYALDLVWGADFLTCSISLTGGKIFLQLTNLN